MRAGTSQEGQSKLADAQRVRREMSGSLRRWVNKGKGFQGAGWRPRGGSGAIWVCGQIRDFEE